MTKSLLTHCVAAALAGVIVVAGADIALAKKGGHGHGKHKAHAHGLSHKAHWKHSYARHTPPGWSKGNKRGWGCVPGTVGCVPPGQRF